jgi:Na+/H+ antiporter NhaA
MFQRFFWTETLGGLVLLGFGLAGLAIANSPLSEAYNHLWEIPLTVGIAPHELSLSFHEWINDGLMAVFFLLVGLEIRKRSLRLSRRWKCNFANTQTRTGVAQFLGVRGNAAVRVCECRSQN